MVGFSTRARETARPALVVLVVVVLCTGLLVTPDRALASRLDSDRIGGIAYSTGLVPVAQTPDISGRSGELVSSSGAVLWSRRIDTRRRMASTTKVMTALLVLERCDLDDVVRVPAAATRVGYATGLKAGERRTVRTLLELALVPSSNDAATALAVHTSGSVSRFVALMNARAAELGLRNTHYANPHGLDQAGHYSSARDLTKLMTAAMKQSEFRRILKLRSVRLPAYGTRAARTLKNTNELLGEVEGLRGGKTGYTDDARYCLVARASRDGVTLTSVVLGAPSSSARFRSTRTLLEWGFKHYRTTQLCAQGQFAGSVPLAAGSTQRVTARLSETTSAPVFDLLGPVAKRVTLPLALEVPVYEGQRLGTVSFIQGSNVIARVGALAAHARASAEETVGLLPVAGYHDRTLVVRTAPSTAPVAAYDTSRPVERTIELPDRVIPPIGLGQTLGIVTYSQDGRTLVAVPAIAAEAVEAPGLLEQALDWYSRAARLVTQP